ncbi:MAG: choice-of-anchor Q domain-containing protein [Chloroflexota bacterium]
MAGSVVRAPSDSRGRLLALRRAATLALLLAALSLAPSPALAATLTVNRSDDAGDGTCDATCTLRDAIASANVAGGAVIVFQPGLTSPITLAGSELTISKSLTISGPGARILAVDAAMASRVLSVTGGSALVRGLTLSGGNAFLGGAVTNAATLTLADVVVSGSSTTTGGGGVFNDTGATLTLTGSTLTGNSAGTAGGGLYNRGTTSATNLTISGNVAAIGLGGGILNEGTLSLTNGTIASNGATTGGGISNSATLTLKNTVVANQSFGGNCSGTPAGGASSNNLQDSGTSCGAGFAVGTVGLGPLTDNGGPTNTHALVAGSAALNTGSNAACPGTDQRGAPRAQTVADPCDIGAYEKAAFIVTKTTDTNDGACSVPDCSLREALAAAGAGDAIGFAPGLAGTITLGGAELPVARSVSIVGPGPAVLAVSGNGASRVFNVSASGVTISGLTIRGGNAFNGGGILNSGGLTVRGSTITSNAASNLGGGLYNATNASLVLVASVVSGNTVIGGGGGIVNVTSGTLAITDSVVSGNSATAGAGGIYNALSGTATVDNSTIAGNTTPQAGGGIVNGGTMTLTRSTVSGNASTGFGGGISNSKTLTAVNSTVSGNTAGAGQGGGVYNSRDLLATNLTITANTAGVGLGGGLRNVSGTAILRNTLVANQVAGDNCSGTPADAASVANLQDVGPSCGTGFAINPAINLGPLQLNGGLTKSHAIGAGSAAIDAGNNAVCPPTDQRGSSRPQHGSCDVGAFETLFPSPRYGAEVAAPGPPPPAHRAPAQSAGTIPRRSPLPRP